MITGIFHRIQNKDDTFFELREIFTESLTLSWRKSLSSRKQSIDLQSKNWFLYDRDLRHERLKFQFCFLWILNAQSKIESGQNKFFGNQINLKDF